MAQYKIAYHCGHGSVTKQLFGKHDERNRKIKWMEANMVCPACYRASLAHQPVTARIIYNAFSGGVWLAVTGGDAFTIKDQLKGAGCQWRDYQDNSDFLGASRAQKAWMIFIAPRPDSDDFDARLRASIDALKACGVEQITVDQDVGSRMSYDLASKHGGE